MTLAGLRVLVVEDEMLVSLLIEDTLADSDCVIVGPFDRVPNALSAALVEPVDVAVLDVNVAGVRVYPVAEVLAARGIPFLLLSGYGQDAVPTTHPEWRACSKPFTPKDLISKLCGQVEQAADIKSRTP